MPTPPPFLLTYWNPFNKNSTGLGQSFLNYVKDVSLADYTGSVVGSVVGSYIENSSKEQISELKEGFSFLDQRMARVEQEQINTNILLENIGELLKVPDSEKQRQRDIELGIKFSNEALKDEDLAIDAKNYFDESLSIMHQDWFVLQQLGILTLYHQKVMDISAAKDFFLKAAKYAAADSESKGSTLINDLFKKQLSKPFNEQIEDNNVVLKDFVRECYLNAALCSYILLDFEE